MEPNNRNCRGCGNDYRVTERQIARILASPMFQSDACVPEPVYRERLDACMQCPKLLGGTTCAVCGCIVKVTAKLRERVCPLPGDNRWSQASL